LVSNRIQRLEGSPHLVSNFFHYRTAIPILGWEFADVFRNGRLTLDPRRWADFGPLNFQLGPPPGLARALRKRITDENLGPYPPNILPELKQAAAKRIFRRGCGSDFDIIGTEGAQSAMAYSLLAAIDRGDEVLITDPGYFFLEPAVIAAGGSTRRIVLSAANGYRVDPEEAARRITPRTKAIIVCDPGNPFGKVQTREELRGLARLAERKGLLLIHNITHGFHRLSRRRHHPLCSLKGCRQSNVITVSGLSHGFGLAGARVGFVAGSPELMRAVLAAKSAITRINVGSLAQEAALAALKDGRFIERCSNTLKRNLERLRKIVRGRPPLRFVTEPEYGYFACVDTSGLRTSCQELTVALLKRRCAVYPADGLGGERATSYLRMNFSTPHAAHFSRLEAALPGAIREAESGIYRDAVVRFFRGTGTGRGKRLAREIGSLPRA